MRVVITGATGFIGRALVQALLGRGDEVVAWTRDAEKARALLGRDVTLASGDQLDAAIDGAAAVINLAGEPIVGRWTEAKKARLIRSRVALTERVIASIERARQRPQVLVSASAIGIFQGGFLQDLCERWEQASHAAKALDVRVVNPRIGLVLGQDGGMLASMAPAFQLGVGGRVGSGAQGMSWIHLDDMVRVLLFAVDTPDLQGPLTATAPNPVSNAEFTQALGKAMGRPTVIPVPAFAIKLALGEAAMLLLEGVQVRPDELIAAGFAFRFEHLSEALGEVYADDSGPRFGEPDEVPSELHGKTRPRSTLKQEVRLDAPIDRVFPFFSAAANLGLLTPTWMGFRILQGPTGAVQRGDRIDYRIKVGPVPMRWHTTIETWEPGVRFVDNQTRGPYALWWHEHRFESRGAQTIMSDTVYFTAPLGFLGRLFEPWIIRPMLRRVFRYRQAAIARLFPSS